MQFEYNADDKRDATTFTVDDNLTGDVRISVPGEKYTRLASSARHEVRFPLEALYEFLGNPVAFRHDSGNLRDQVTALLRLVLSPPSGREPGAMMATCGCVFVESPTETVWLVRCDSPEHDDYAANDPMTAVDLKTLSNQIAGWKDASKALAQAREELESEKTTRREMLGKLVTRDGEIARLASDFRASQAARLLAAPCGCVYGPSAPGDAQRCECGVPGHAPCDVSDLKLMGPDEVSAYGKKIRDYRRKAMRLDALVKALRPALGS